MLWVEESYKRWKTAWTLSASHTIAQTVAKAGATMLGMFFGPTEVDIGVTPTAYFLKGVAGDPVCCITHGKTFSSFSLDPSNLVLKSSTRASEFVIAGFTEATDYREYVVMGSNAKFRFAPARVVHSQWYDLLRATMRPWFA
jgi:hypothetical protein